MNLVLLTSDTDCDGTSYGAHRIVVPEPLGPEFLEDSHAAMKYAKETDQMSSYYDMADEVLTEDDFYATFGPEMRPRDLTYFTEEGYTSRHIEPNWNPWVYDDTIGIPALDTRYED
jgi:hypothetical protein